MVGGGENKPDEFKCTGTATQVPIPSSPSVEEAPLIDRQMSMRVQAGRGSTGGSTGGCFRGVSEVCGTWARLEGCVSCEATRRRVCVKSVERVRKSGSRVAHFWRPPRSCTRAPTWHPRIWPRARPCLKHACQMLRVHLSSFVGRAGHAASRQINETGCALSANDLLKNHRGFTGSVRCHSAAEPP